MPERYQAIIDQRRPRRIGQLREIMEDPDGSVARIYQEQGYNTASEALVLAVSQGYDVDKAKQLAKKLFTRTELMGKS